MSHWRSILPHRTFWSLAVCELSALGCVTFCERTNICFGHQGLPSLWHQAERVTPPNPSTDRGMGDLVNEYTRDVWVCGCLNWWYEYFIVRCYELKPSLCSFFWVLGWLPSLKSKRKMTKEEVEKGVEEKKWAVGPKNMAPPGLFLDVICHLFIQQIVIELGSPLKHTEVNNMCWLSKNFSLKRKRWPPPNQDPNPKMLDFKCRRPILTPQITNAQKINKLSQVVIQDFTDEFCQRRKDVKIRDPREAK